MNTKICSYRDAIKLLLCHAADTLSQSVDTLTVEEIGGCSRRLSALMDGERR